MKPRSAKNKGRRLQNDVVADLHEHYPELRQGDVKAAIMGEAGRDIGLSPAAEDVIPLDIECKNQERLNIWDALKQAASNTKDGRIPAVVFKRNRSKTYVALEWQHLLLLMSRK